MAVIITDMKFPKRCLDCQLLGREKMYCQLHPRKNLNVIRVVSEKPEWCSLKEVCDRPSRECARILTKPNSRDKYDTYFYCSNCEGIIPIYYNEINYCPNCGAKMVEVEE